MTYSITIPNIEGFSRKIRFQNCLDLLFGDACIIYSKMTNEKFYAHTIIMSQYFCCGIHSVLIFVFPIYQRIIFNLIIIFYSLVDNGAQFSFVL